MLMDDETKLNEWRQLAKSMLETFEFDDRTRGLPTELEPSNSSTSLLISVLWKLAMDTDYNATQVLSPVMSNFRMVDEQLQKLPSHSTEYAPTLIEWFRFSAILRKELREILAAVPEDPREHPHRRAIRHLFLRNYR